MDPNETLKQLLSKASELRGILESEAPVDGDQLALALEVVDLLQALDGWLAKGGFPPDRWMVQERQQYLPGPAVSGTLGQEARSKGATKPSDREEIKALMVGVGKFDDETIVKLVAASGSFVEYLHHKFEMEPTEPMLLALAQVLIEACQDQTQFTRETFLDWMGKQWEAMVELGPGAPDKERLQ